MMELPEDQRDEIELFDAMKKSQNEFNWALSRTGKVCGFMSVIPELVKVPVVVCQDTSPYRQVQGVSAKKNREESVELMHLPPIKLQFQLPKEYPDKCPPTYNLCCNWLNFSQLSILCRKLDQIWIDCDCSVILYNWQQFLKSDSLQILKLTEKIFIEYQNPKRKLSDWDTRSIQEIDHPLLVIPSLIEYNESKTNELFLSSRFNCEICFLTELGSNCIKLHSCQHIHCKICTRSHIIAKIEDGMVNKVDCPASDCKELISPDVIRSLVPPELFQRYDDLLLQRTLDTMSDIVHCPRQTCLCATIKEEDSNMIVCPRCKFSFCCLCKRTWHGISPCRLLPDNLHELKLMYENGDPEFRLSIEQQYGRSHLLKAFQEVESNSWLKQYSKKCPNCQSSIEKSHGCNKMTCTCCHASFCWICEALLPVHNPYSHFHFGSSGCAGKLFDGINDEEDELV